METKRLPIVLQFLILSLVVLAAQVYSVTEDVGEWGEWSPCTRTCGPAVSTQEKDCLNRTCEGPRKQFRSCRNNPCEEPLDLREEVCAAHNDRNYTYTPLNAGESQCSLTCKATAADGHMIVLGPLEALTGTPCTTVYGDAGQCVEALCTPLGCDGLLGSRRATDKCGRCFIEDDVTCIPTFGTQTQPPAAGHVEMVSIPAGAWSLNITNLLQPQQASLMVRSASGDFLFTVGPPGSKFLAGGTEFTYDVRVEGGNFTESLTAYGPLNASVTIEVYIPSTEVAPSTIYEYHTLQENPGPWGSVGPRNHIVTSTYSFDWVYKHFLPCTDTCASGIQSAHAVCRDLVFKKDLPDRYCTAEKPTPIVRRCGSEECTPRWVSSEWGACSETTCGTGLQQRLVQCRVLEASGRDTVVSDDRCSAALRPAHERECIIRESSGCDTMWEVEEWGECCTQEPLERSVVCVDATGHPQPPFLCNHLPRNSSIKTCERGPCSNGGCYWVPKRWFVCNNTCGQGVERRNVRCRNSESKAADAYCCRDQPLPIKQRECHDDRRCHEQPRWHTGTWTQCSGRCGNMEGERRRTVECLAEKRQGVTVPFPDHFCQNASLPVETELCTREDLQCSNCQWEAGQWSNCYCPLGIRLRSVVCSNGNDDCCYHRDGGRLPDGETCACSTESPDLLTSPPPCVDHPLVNCTQLRDEGYCYNDNTDFFEQLCCHACSSFVR